MIDKIFSGYVKITEEDIKKAQGKRKLKSLEDVQIPRWQMVKMYAEMEDPSQLSDSPKARGELIKQARDAHQKRMDNLDRLEQARQTGMEWKKREKPFTEEELDKILPERPNNQKKLFLLQIKGLFKFLLLTTIALTGLLSALISITHLMHGPEYLGDLTEYISHPLDLLRKIKEGFIKFQQELVNKPLPTPKMPF